MRVFPSAVGGAMPESLFLPWTRASPTRCLAAGPSPGSTRGSRASTNPNAICVLCQVGETSVSPKTPTAPPFGLTIACVANDVSLSWNAPLEQLMLRTTGNMAPFVSASTLPLWKAGVSQLAVPP